MTREELNNHKWWAKFKIAKEYYLEHGNLLVPRRCIFKNVCLGTWISSQRKWYKKGLLSQERIDALNSIEMVWSVRTDTVSWDKAYEIACSYKKEYGNLIVPEDFIYHNYNLGSWIRAQRFDKENNLLSEDKIQKLDKINMIWNLHDYVWEQKYLLAEKYYLEHGHLIVGQDNKELQSWLTSQRIRYEKNKLSDYRIEKLEILNMIWDLVEYRWNVYYLMARNYYFYYGNLNVKNNKELENWLTYQRNLHKRGTLEKDKEMMLNELEMIWDLKHYKFLNTKFNKTSLLYRKRKLDVYLQKILNEMDDKKFHNKEDIKEVEESFVRKVYKI